MAQKKVSKMSECISAPKSLEDNLFFGLKLDDDQKALRDAIWDDNIDIVFVDAAAGSGKTTIAVGTSVLLHHYEVVKECHEETIIVTNWVPIDRKE